MTAVTVVGMIAGALLILVASAVFSFLLSFLGNRE